MSTSDLSGLGQVLCSTFATHCPVYSKAGPTSPCMLSPQSSLNQLSALMSARNGGGVPTPVVTDVAFLSAKAKVPQTYTIVSFNPYYQYSSYMFVFVLNKQESSFNLSFFCNVCLD